MLCDAHRISIRQGHVTLRLAPSTWSTQEVLHGGRSFKTEQVLYDVSAVSYRNNDGKEIKRHEYLETQSYRYSRSMLCTALRGEVR
jgi:hypothetical protein